MISVLLAEGDSAAGPLAASLRAEGYDVTRCADGSGALSCALSGGVELILLGEGLRGLDGVGVCRRLRDRGSQLPVVLLSSRSAEADAVAGFDAGADDYVRTPVGSAELLARVRAVLRRSRGAGAVVNGIRLDPGSRRAWHHGAELTLTGKEFELLRVLVREAGSVVAREQLMREVWDATWWGSTKTLDMHVSWLRRKLGDKATNPRYIATVRGVGFRFERG